MIRGIGAALCLVLLGCGGSEPAPVGYGVTDSPGVAAPAGSHAWTAAPRAPDGEPVLPASVVADAPRIEVTKDRHVVLEGDDLGEVVDPKKPESFSLLTAALEGRRKAVKASHPKQSFAGAIVVSAEKGAPAALVKRVVETATDAGYQHVTLR